MDKSLLAEHQQFYNCSPSFQLSTYDSGFFDDQTMDSLTKTACDKSDKKLKNPQRHVSFHN